MQYIPKVESIEKIDSDKIYVYIKGLDLTHIENKSNDLSMTRRVELKNWYKEGFKCFLVFDIEQTDVIIQTSNQVYQKVVRVSEKK